MSVKKLLRGITAALMAACVLAGTAYAEPPADLGAITENGAHADLIGEPLDLPSGDELLSGDSSEFPTFSDSENVKTISLQDGMRAVFVTPETDYQPEDDLMTFFDEAAGFGMNAVIINTTNENNEIYSLELEGDDLIKSSIDAAHFAGLCAYVTLDVNSLLDHVISEGGGLKEGFSAAAHKFAMKYGCEGIILTNYYTSDSKKLYDEYLCSGSGIGYENWLYETNRYILRTLSEVVRKTSETTAVGIYIEDMWANLSDTEEGSDTSFDFRAMYDGYCDTKSYIEQGYADFIIVRALGSTNSTQLKFDNVVSWWGELAEKCGVKMYVNHLNERIGNVEGWYEDQLLKQLDALNKLGLSSGSAFNSFAALRENKLDNTTKLIMFFNDQINTGTLSQELTMTLPKQLNYSTTDKNVKFQGTFDENFDVYFNGEKIKLNEAGYFFFQEPLKVGKNYFTIEHKGKKANYVINREVKVFKSIDNTTNITVEGGTQIAISAAVYSGSKVSASINGKTIQLTEKANSETLDANGSYSEYVGYYTVPEGIVGKVQSLGKITYYAVYTEQGSKSVSETKYGGSVTVEAKPEPPRTDINFDIIDQSTAGTGEVVGTMDPIVSENEYVKYIGVLKNYTMVWDAKTTGLIPSPLFSELPEGTLDYYRSTVDDFVISTSGKRYKKDQVRQFTDRGIGDNALVVKEVGNISGKSFIKIKLDLRISFNVTLSQKLTESSNGNGPYNVQNFDAQYVYITFDNVTSVTKIPDLSKCALFSNGWWETVTDENGIPKFRMVLKLRQAGIYSGVGAYYNENGELMLTFNVPTPSLADKVIMIDPGHGYGRPDPSIFDPGAVGQVTEQKIACEVSKLLEKKLTEMGATVIRLHTEDTYYYTNDRAKEGVKADVDMYISLHCNSAESTTAHGVEVYYFTSFSQPLAKSINDKLASMYDNEIYADGTKSSRGDQYSYYWVTTEKSFPSVLVEMGFVSNKKECLIMAKPENQAKIVDSIAAGIQAYFTRSHLSS